MESLFVWMWKLHQQARFSQLQTQLHPQLHQVLMQKAAPASAMALMTNNASVQIAACERTESDEKQGLAML